MQTGPAVPEGSGLPRSQGGPKSRSVLQPTRGCGPRVLPYSLARVHSGPEPLALDTQPQACGEAPPPPIVVLSFSSCLKQKRWAAAVKAASPLPSPLPRLLSLGGWMRSRLWGGGALERGEVDMWGQGGGSSQAPPTRPGPCQEQQHIRGFAQSRLGREPGEKDRGCEH